MVMIYNCFPATVLDFGSIHPKVTDCVNILKRIYIFHPIYKLLISNTENACKVLFASILSVGRLNWVDLEWAV